MLLVNVQKMIRLQMSNWKRLKQVWDKISLSLSQLSMNCCKIKLQSGQRCLKNIKNLNAYKTRMQSKL
jgi:hypothetical protein